MATIIYAGPAGVGGVENLFNKKRGQKHTKLPSVVKCDSVTVLTSQRFEQFKKFLPFSFEGNDPSDPWNQIMGLVNDFNKNRKLNVAASVKKILDENVTFQIFKASIGEC